MHNLASKLIRLLKYYFVGSHHIAPICNAITGFIQTKVETYCAYNGFCFYYVPHGPICKNAHHFLGYCLITGLLPRRVVRGCPFRMMLIDVEH